MGPEVVGCIIGGMTVSVIGSVVLDCACSAGGFLALQGLGAGHVISTPSNTFFFCNTKGSHSSIAMQSSTVRCSVLTVDISFSGNGLNTIIHHLQSVCIQGELALGNMIQILVMPLIDPLNQHGSW